jgi:hypothetical protein
MDTHAEQMMLGAEITDVNGVDEGGMHETHTEMMQRTQLAMLPPAVQSRTTRGWGRARAAPGNTYACSAPGEWHGHGRDV